MIRVDNGCRGFISVVRVGGKMALRNYAYGAPPAEYRGPVISIRYRVDYSMMWVQLVGGPRQDLRVATSIAGLTSLPLLYPSVHF